MKTVGAALTAHLSGEVTTIATCWKITRTDGVAFHFTDHDSDLVVDGDTYLAATGYQRTAVTNDSSLSVDNLDVEGVFDDEALTKVDLRAGLFDHAEVRIFMVNWADLTQGVLKMRRGHLGEVLLTETGAFRAELRGLTQQLSQSVGEQCQPECRADLGDSRCRVPVQPSVVGRNTAYALGTFVRVVTDGGATGQAQYQNRVYECTAAGTTAGSQPTYSTADGTTTADGTATFTARQAWTRHAVVDTVTDRRTFTLTSALDEPRAVDDWFNGGGLAFESGSNSGKAIEVRDWVQSSRTVTLFLPAPFDVTPGTLVWLYPGCNKSVAHCSTRFVMAGSRDLPSGRGNVLNFRGEPFVPGQDALTWYPDAR